MQNSKAQFTGVQTQNQQNNTQNRLLKHQEPSAFWDGSELWFYVTEPRNWIILRM